MGKRPDDQKDRKDIGIGDMIMLRTGGPLMTVTDSWDNTLNASWFNSENYFVTKEFDRKTVFHVSRSMIGQSLHIDIRKNLDTTNTTTLR